MPEHRVKILKNVFLSADENLLKLVDIQFSDSIEKIIDRTSAKINWQETNTFEKRKKIIRSFQQTEYPSEVKIYDGEFFVVIPGGIDSHVHFNTPGFEDRDDF